MQAIRAEVNDGDGVSIWVTGDIGWDVDFRDLQRAVDFYQDRQITLEIFNFGGSYFDALAFYEYVKAKGYDLNANIWGLAASAATIVAMAAKPKNIQMGQNSFWMMHNVHGGDEAKNAQFSQQLSEIYAKHSGGDAKDIAAMMKAETFLSAKDAKDKGYVGGIMAEAVNVAARYADAEPFKTNGPKPDNKKHMSDTTIKVKAKVKLNGLDAVKAALGDGVEVDVDVPVDQETAEIKNQLESAVADLADARKEAEDLKASAGEVEILKAELEEANKATTAEAGKVKDLQAKMADLQKKFDELQNAGANGNLKNDNGKTQSPGAPPQEEKKLTAAAKVLKNILDETSEFERSALGPKKDAE